MNDILHGLIENDKYVDKMNQFQQSYDIEFDSMIARIDAFIENDPLENITYDEFLELTRLVNKYGVRTSRQWMDILMEVQRNKAGHSSQSLTA